MTGLGWMDYSSYIVCVLLVTCSLWLDCNIPGTCVVVQLQLETITEIGSCVYWHLCYGDYQASQQAFKTFISVVLPLKPLFLLKKAFIYKNSLYFANDSLFIFIALTLSGLHKSQNSLFSTIKHLTHDWMSYLMCNKFYMYNS